MSNELTQPKPTYPRPPNEGDPSWVPVRNFLSRFHASILCYIPDAESLKSLPVTHSDVLDLDKQEQGYGVFYSVNGFKSARSRTVENLLSINAFYVDIDYPKDRPGLGKPTPDQLAAFKSDALKDLSALASEDGTRSFVPSFIVETKNGLHALWLFEEPIILDNLPPERRTRLLQAYTDVLLALIDRFQGDPQAKDLVRVLRLPNTFHLKDPHSPFRVRLLPMDTETYAFKELKNFFLHNAANAPSELGKPSTSDGSKPKNAGSRNLETGDDVFDFTNLAWKHTDSRDPIPAEIWQELRHRYPKTDRPSVQALMAKDGIAEGGRNHSLLIATSAMRESGMSESEVLGYFDHYNGLSVYEITQTVKSAFKRPEPMSFGWNNPLIAVHVTEAEKAKVSAVLGTILNERRAAKQAAHTNKKSKELQTHPDFAGPYVPVIHKLEPDVEREAKRIIEKRTVAQEKAFQKNLFNNYEKVILERFPRLRFCLTDGCFYDFESGRYVLRNMDSISDMILRELETDGLMDFRTTTQVKNKIACLRSLEVIQMRMPDPADDPATLNVLNGLLDFTTGDLRLHTPEYFSTNQLPVRYRDEPIEDIAPRWVSFVEEIMQSDAGKIRFLQQMSGYCFTRSVAHQKAFILYGTGANGKSTFIDTLQRILGPNNASSLTLKDLHKQFGLTQIFGKTMNVIEEISENFFESDMIKKIITGSEITADRKFMDHLVFRPFAKFVFAVNDLPRIKDTSTGLYRRFHIVDFLASFDESKAEPDLAERLWDERDGIFLWCMKGWQDLVSAGGFMVPPAVAAASERFKEANSPLVEFLLRRYNIAESGREMSFMIPVTHIFEAYQKEVRELGYQPKNFQNVSKELANLNHGSLKHVSVVPINGTKMVSGLMLKKTGPLQPLTPSFQ